MGETRTRQLQRIVRDYIDTGEPWPAEGRSIAAWAIRMKRWAPQMNSLIQQCADQLSRAMREELIRDPQGRIVRAKHAATFGTGPKQTTLWADIRSANRQHMAVAFQQRRQQIVGDCRQLKLDVDSYNENGNRGLPIQVVFDFRNDLDELLSA